MSAYSVVTFYMCQPISRSGLIGAIVSEPRCCPEVCQRGGMMVGIIVGLTFLLLLPLPWLLFISTFRW
ncbi:hypothetical protein BDR03DRAFT_962556 [Suillus americanus]|nr:hypothetical protein BDR03DRAFT_962556 [Suillus americanus]